MKKIAIEQSGLKGVLNWAWNGVEYKTVSTINLDELNQMIESNRSIMERNIKSIVMKKAIDYDLKTYTKSKE